MNAIKAKVKTKLEKLAKVIWECFYKSLILYHYMPLLAAGICATSVIDKI